MKKFFIYFCSLTIVISLIGCSKETSNKISESESEKSKKPISSNEKINDKKDTEDPYKELKSFYGANYDELSKYSSDMNTEYEKYINDEDSKYDNLVDELKTKLNGINVYQFKNMEESESHKLLGYFLTSQLLNLNSYEAFNDDLMVTFSDANPKEPLSDFFYDIYNDNGNFPGQPTGIDFYYGLDSNRKSLEEMILGDSEIVGATKEQEAELPIDSLIAALNFHNYDRAATYFSEDWILSHNLKEDEVASYLEENTPKDFKFNIAFNVSFDNSGWGSSDDGEFRRVNSGVSIQNLIDCNSSTEEQGFNFFTSQHNGEWKIDRVTSLSGEDSFLTTLLAE